MRKWFKSCSNLICIAVIGAGWISLWGDLQIIISQ